MGRNPAAPYLLASIDIVQETIDVYPLGRIRDVYTNDSGDKVFILTRNYGKEWEHVDEALSKHPTFIRKFSESDPTYTVYEFGVPEKFKIHVKIIADACDNTPAFERYRKAINDMADDKENAQTKYMLNVGEKIISKLMDSFNTGENKEVSNEFGAVHIINGGKDGRDNI
jgi:hypothetical protein